MGKITTPRGWGARFTLPGESTHMLLCHVWGTGEPLEIYRCRVLAINGPIVGHAIDKCLAFGAQFWRDYVEHKRVVYSDESTCFAFVDISRHIGFDFICTTLLTNCYQYNKSIIWLFDLLSDYCSTLIKFVCCKKIINKKLKRLVLETVTCTLLNKLLLFISCNILNICFMYW